MMRAVKNYALATAMSGLSITATFGGGVLAAESTQSAGAVIALRTIPAGSVIEAVDVDLINRGAGGKSLSLDEVIGSEARVVLFAGHVIRPGDTREAALINRNQSVVLQFSRGVLSIRTEGRALERGAVGERVRVMNIDSRTVISGIVSESGAVIVGRAQ